MHSLKFAAMTMQWKTCAQRGRHHRIKVRPPPAGPIRTAVTAASTETVSEVRGRRAEEGRR